MDALYRGRLVPTQCMLDLGDVCDCHHTLFVLLATLVISPSHPEPPRGALLFWRAVEGSHQGYQSRNIGDPPNRSLGRSASIDSDEFWRPRRVAGFAGWRNLSPRRRACRPLRASATTETAPLIVVVR
jgi:hypothetical protein